MRSERVLSKPPFYFFPGVHYSTESAVELLKAFDEIKPDCVAVELPKTMAKEVGDAVSRLPDLSLIVIKRKSEEVALHVEPCDPFFEAIRKAQELSIPAYLIDLDVEKYPSFYDPLPDTYAISKIGLRNYWTAITQAQTSSPPLSDLDLKRETYMAKELKALSYSYERILVITGLRHTQSVASKTALPNFPEYEHADIESISVKTYSDSCAREIMATFGYLTEAYEEQRKNPNFDRNLLHINLLKEARTIYELEARVKVPPVRLALTLQFARNMALRSGRLLPSMYQLLIAARSCVDHRYAYEVWKLASSYSHLKNVDNLEIISIDPKLLWGSEAHFKFILKTRSGKERPTERLRKDQTKQKFFPLNPQGICSFPPEDKVVERVGDRLKHRGVLLANDATSSSIPFTSSLEDGIDIRETIRHWVDKTLYVKKPSGKKGESASCVLIFEPELRESNNYSWMMSWLGEHDQESDMAFYATNPLKDVVGPGIARAIYGGFLLVSPPRRLFDVWQDPDYEAFTTKEEVLLAAAIDYATKPIVVYAAAKPPKDHLKTRAARQGKQILYIPLSSLGTFELQKIKRFHVLDSHDTRKHASDFIF